MVPKAVWHDSGSSFGLWSCCLEQHSPLKASLQPPIPLSSLLYDICICTPHPSLTLTLLPAHLYCSHSRYALPLTSVPSPNARTRQVMEEAGGMGTNPRISFLAGRCSLPKECTIKLGTPFRNPLEVLWARMDATGWSSGG